MEQKTENRRVRMTKQLMKDALLELLEKQDLTSISVTLLCETADVHRSTFYKYYSDPADLLSDIEQGFLDQIPMPSKDMSLQNKEQLLLSTTAFFDLVKQNEKAYRILFNESAGSHFPSRLVALQYEYLRSLDSASDDMADRYRDLYIANGTVGMLREWINSGFSISSREIAELMYNLANN